MKTRTETGGGGGGGGDDGFKTTTEEKLNKILSDPASAAGAGAYLNALLNQQRLEAQKEGAAKQAEYLRSLIGQGVSKDVLAELARQQSTGEDYIRRQTELITKQLGERRTTAEGRSAEAFNALRTYLTGNAPTAYATAQRAVPEVTQTALGQYMTGQGVSPAVAQEAAQLANVQAAGGASNYNQLLNVLAGREAAMQQSRLAEEQLARTTAQRALEQIYGTAVAATERQQLDALAQLASRLGTARLSAEQQAAQRDVALQNALAAIYGAGFASPPPAPVAEGDAAASNVPATAGLTPIQILQQLTANAATRNPALARRVQAAAAANPAATVQQLRTGRGLPQAAGAFPQLAQAIRRRMGQ